MLFSIEEDRRRMSVITNDRRECGDLIMPPQRHEIARIDLADSEPQFCLINKLLPFF